jgi:hypothetical protein
VVDKRQGRLSLALSCGALFPPWGAPRPVSEHPQPPRSGLPEHVSVFTIGLRDKLPVVFGGKARQTPREKRYKLPVENLLISQVFVEKTCRNDLRSYGRP